MSIEETHGSKDDRNQSARAYWDMEDSEYMWLSTSKAPINHALQDYEQSYLRCPICREFYRNAVYIKSCHHTFCSECVRKAFKEGIANMRRRQECPCCKIEIKDENAELIPDFGLQRCVNEFQKFRGLLKSALDDSSNRHSPAATSDVNDGKSVTIETRVSKRIRRLNCDDVKCDSNTSSSLQSRSFTVKASTDVAFLCPQRKPTPHYHGMKKKQLESLCRDAGLPSNGSEEELKERHRNFILLWNSECDSETPRSEAEIVREIIRREDLRRKEARIQNFINTPKVPNGKDSFKALIEQCRMRKEASTKMIPGSDKKLDMNNQRAISTDGDIILIDVGVEPIVDNEDLVTCTKNTKEKTTAIQPINYKSYELQGSSEQQATPKPLYRKSDEMQSIHLYKKQQDESTLNWNIIPSPSSATSNINPLTNRNLSCEQSIIGEWTCSRCTFVNSVRTWKGAKCEMCSSSRLSKNS